MTGSSTSEAKDLISLAARMGIPADEAIRQVGQLIDHDHVPEEPAPEEPAPEVTAPPVIAGTAGR